MAIPPKKLAIITTTLRLINSQGFHASPMSQIAREAGVAAGTIYHYFRSKDDLIVEVYDHVKQRMGEALMQNVEMATNYKAQFWVFWLNQYSFFSQNPAEYWFLEQYAVSPFIKQETVEASRHHYQPIIDFIAHGIAQGVLKPLDPALLAHLLNTQVTAIVKLELTGAYAPSMESLQEIVQCSWDMVKRVV